MIFKYLINSVNYDDVWVELRNGYKLEKSAYEIYKRVLEELKTLEPRLRSIKIFPLYLYF